MSDSRLKGVLSSSNFEEFAKAQYDYMKPESQRNRIETTVSSVVSSVGESISVGKTSVTFTGMLAISDISVDYHTTLFESARISVDGNWDIDSTWEIDKKKDEAIVTWKNKLGV